MNVAALVGLSTLAVNAEIPTCGTLDNLGCRLLSSLSDVASHFEDQSIEDVNALQFQWYLTGVESCGAHDAATECIFWESWASSVFDEVDTNNDGVIDTLEKLAYSASVEQELAIGDQITEAENEDGITPGVESRVDFVKAFKAHMLAEAFLAADIDGDFVLSLDEMRVLAGDDSVQVQTRSSVPGIDQIPVKEIVTGLYALPTAHLYNVLLPAIHGNNVVVGLTKQRRRLFFTLACIWLCTLAVASVATIAAETIKGSSPCEFAPGTRLGQLERLETGCSH